MKKTIMLACAAGMSTSLLVTKMEKAAAQQQKEVSILAVPVGEADIYAKEHEVDIILLGPQVRYLEKEFKAQFEPAIPVATIPMVDYGMMNGENVLALALDLLE